MDLKRRASGQDVSNQWQGLSWGGDWMDSSWKIIHHHHPVLTDLSPPSSAWWRERGKTWHTVKGGGENHWETNSILDKRGGVGHLRAFRTKTHLILLYRQTKGAGLFYLLLPHATMHQGSSREREREYLVSYYVWWDDEWSVTGNRIRSCRYFFLPDPDSLRSPSCHFTDRTLCLLIGRSRRGLKCWQHRCSHRIKKGQPFSRAHGNFRPSSFFLSLFFSFSSSFFHF